MFLLKILNTTLLKSVFHLSLLLILFFLFFKSVSAIVYQCSYWVQSKENRLFFFFFNSIKNKERFIFYIKYNCWSLGKTNIYKPIKLGGTPWDFHFCKL